MFAHRLLLDTLDGQQAGSLIFGTHKSRSPCAEDIVSSGSSPPCEESVVPRNVGRLYKCSDQLSANVYRDASPRKPEKRQCSSFDVSRVSPVTQITLLHGRDTLLLVHA